MLARWWTFGVWALVAGSALFWGLRVFVQAPAAPRDTVVAQPGGDLRGDLTRLFGADAPPPAAPVEEVAVPAPNPRFVLVGVLSPRAAGAAREGVALIATDGNPAKAYRVGQVVDGNTVLQTVSARGAQLGARGGPATVALELAPLPAAATGTLPSIGGQGAQTSIGGQGAPGPGRPPGQPPGMPNAAFNPNQQPQFADTQVLQAEPSQSAADTAALR